eukprot:7247899-Pyramimonas_sp.AAC.1
MASLTSVLRDAAERPWRGGCSAILCEREPPVELPPAPAAKSEASSPGAAVSPGVVEDIAGR